MFRMIISFSKTNIEMCNLINFIIYFYKFYLHKIKLDTKFSRNCLNIMINNLKHSMNNLFKLKIKKYSKNCCY